MKMKNIFTKAFVCAGVLASAIALSSVVAFAADATFNITDVTAIDAQKYTGNALDATSTDKELFKSDGYTVTALGVTQPVAIVDLSDSSYKDYSSSEGELKDTKFNNLLFTTGGSSKNFISISGVSENQTIGVYFTGTDSKGAAGKANEIKVGSSTATATKNTCSYKEYTVAAGETTVYIANTGSRVGVYAITIKDFDSSVTNYRVEIAEKGETYAGYPDITAELDSKTEPTKATLSWNANENYLAGTTDVTLTDKMLSDTTYTIPWTAFVDEIEEKVSAQNINTVAYLNANDLSGTLQDTAVLETYFTVSDSQNGGLSAASFDGSFADVTYTHSIAMGGSGNKNKRAIKFTTNGAAYIQFVAASNSSSGTRNIVLADETTNLKTTGLTSKTPVAINYYATSAGTYYIYPEASIHLLSVAVVVGEGLITDGVSNGAVFADTADAYALAAVSDSDLSNDSIAITMDGKTSTPADTSVYKAVKVDNIVITADDIGADFIYAVKGTGAVTKDKLDVAKAFTIALG